MSMNQHENFILNSIIHSLDFKSLGEEIRSMQMTLVIEYLKFKDPIYELLIALIEKYTDDEELGFYVYKIKEKLYEYFTNQN